MSEISPIFVVIFVILWFLAIVEMLGIFTFSPWAFRFGICLFREARLLPVPGADIGARFETENGVFEMIGPTECLFRWKFGRASFEPTAAGVFPIKGNIRWDGLQGTIKGRSPLFPPLFATTFVVCWFLGMSQVVLTSSSPTTQGFPFGAVVAFLVGMAVVVGICLVLIRLELRRIRQLLDEYETIVNRPQRDAASLSEPIDLFGQIHREE